jgi:hypothetical protein
MDRLDHLCDALGPLVTVRAAWAPVYQHWEDPELEVPPIGRAGHVRLALPGLCVKLFEGRRAVQVKVEWFLVSHTEDRWRIAPGEKEMRHLANAGLTLIGTRASFETDRLEPAIRVARAAFAVPVRVLRPDDVPDLPWSLLYENLLWEPLPLRVERADGEVRLEQSRWATVVFREGPEFDAAVTWLRRFRPRFAAMLD